ncbi:single-strand DNA endonuclease ASTE1 [Brachyistius frenatus]|uniref:single-strand DNA endonuclease ASTE1 n=1 Tax=Brachyistius frenatus TaxID=100188 RepID=UPI0037E7DDFF
MGVQGLASLLERHRRIYLDVEFRMNRLVVDGNNLLHLLYFNSGLDQNHGGEYAAFEDLTERFVTALRSCGVAPYVVLDGGTDTSDKKLETVTKRALEQIEKVHRAAMTGESKNIMPALAKQVFQQTLVRLEVPVAQCFAEADWEVAALATEWKCPVLSNDSDFYVFDLPAGLLPISHFHWQDVKQKGSQRYIPCKRYYASCFCIYFNIKQQLLPAFAALSGNDYVQVRGIRWTEFAPEGSETPSRLEGLLRWLRDFQQPQEALKASLGLMGEPSKNSEAEVMQKLDLGMEEYRLPASSLKRFFVDGVAPPLPAVDEALAVVPDWTRLPLTQARLTPHVLDVLLLQRIKLSIAVEHTGLPSTNRTSRPLRQVMYGLLLGGRRWLRVEERDRAGLDLTFIPVAPTFTGAVQRLGLGTLHEANPAERLQVLLEALGVTEAALSRLPPQLRLPVAVTCYWLQRAQPPPDLTELKALLVVMMDKVSPGHKAALQHQYCQQKPDVLVSQVFNQWQVCLKDSIHLNQLLDFPLPDPEVARLYQGTLVHQLVHRMRTGGRLKNFLKSRGRYNIALSVVHQFLTRRAPTSSEPRGRRPPADLTAEPQLALLYEDEETEDRSAVRMQEEMLLDNQLSVRTRYRTKDRVNRCNKPQLSRKQECRGWGIL